MSTTTPGIDPRGARFAAAVTALVLAAVLLTAPSALATGLLAVQTVVFAVGALRGVQHTPYSRAYRRLVLPRIGPPAEREDAAPPRFAQAVGLGFAAVGLLAFVAGADLLGLVAAGFALAAALLNAVFGFCLGCEMYLLIKRLTGPRVVPVGSD
jgi:hypothetical protein